MPKVNIKTIPHKKQKYNTAGDYWLDKDGTIQVRISDLGNEDFEWLVLFHELIELYLTKKRKIPWKKIDHFDRNFEKQKLNLNDNSSWGDEPGDNPQAPYYKEHQFASGIEHVIAEVAKIDWDKYNKSFDNL